jgi:hypothetical protein
VNATTQDKTNPTLLCFDLDLKILFREKANLAQLYLKSPATDWGYQFYRVQSLSKAKIQAIRKTHVSSC